MLVHELLLEAEELEGTARAMTFTQELRDLAKAQGLITEGTVKFRHQKSMTPAHYDVQMDFGLTAKKIKSNDDDETAIDMRLIQLLLKKWLKSKQDEGLTFVADDAISITGIGWLSTIWLRCKLYLPLHHAVKRQLRLTVFGYVLPRGLEEPIFGAYEKLHDGKKPPYPYFSEPISTSVDPGTIIPLRHHLNPNSTPDLPALNRFAIALAERYAPKLKGMEMGIRRNDSTIPASIITDQQLANGFSVVSKLDVNKTSGRTTEVPEDEFLDLFVQFFPKLKHLR